jgi:hypothetical protein
MRGKYLFSGRHCNFMYGVPAGNDFTSGIYFFISVLPADLQSRCW